MADDAAVRRLAARGLSVLPTPGHTAGHVSLLASDLGALFVGDLVGSAGGQLVRGPAAFTADPEKAEQSLCRLTKVDAPRLSFSHGPEIDDPRAALTSLLA